ncbi:MAG: erythromycin esterase family protein [Bacteroidales bacterium]
MANDQEYVKFDVSEVLDILEESAHDVSEGLEPLYDRIKDARIVMLGEASHGTHEYYLWRSKISKYLIQHKGFNTIAVEGDWPACYALNRYIRHYGNSGKNTTQVVESFNRWPTWMWANFEITALIDWLRKYNQGKPFNRQVGFYGLDVYSLWESLEEISGYLKKNDPVAHKTALEAMACFEPYDKEGVEYAGSTRFAPDTCEDEVVRLLQEIRSRVPLYNTDPEGPFNVEQNAMTAVNAEKYYRAMIRGGPESWNIRDTHMTQTLEKLLQFQGPGAKAIVWEHNTHIGDARATDMAAGGLVNVGQLVREKWGEEETVAVGFGSYEGSVVASEAWGSPMKEMEMPPARENSVEYLLHHVRPADKLIISEDLAKSKSFFEYMDHRAIGVVYHSRYEKEGNYVPSVIRSRYDAFLFFDETTPLHPLGVGSDTRKVPETYPWGV